MNRLIMIGIVLGGGTVAFDRLVHKIPQGLAVVLFSAAVILIIAGMIVTRAAGA